MKISGFGEQDTGAWDTLHKGTDREEFDSPSHYELSTLKTRLPHRRPASPPPAPVPPPSADSDSDSDDGYEWVEDGESGYWQQTGPSSGYYDTESYLTHDDRQVPDDSAYGRHPAPPTTERARHHRDSPAPAAEYYESVDSSGHYDERSGSADSGYYAAEAAGPAGEFYDSREPAGSGYFAAPGVEEYAGSADSGRYAGGAAGPAGEFYDSREPAGSGYFAAPAVEEYAGSADSGRYATGAAGPAGESYDSRERTGSGYFAAPAVEEYYDSREQTGSGYFASPAGEDYYDSADSGYHPSSYDPNEPAEPTGRHAIVERTAGPNRRADPARRHAAVDTADREPVHRPASADPGYAPPSDGRHQHRLAEPPDHSPARRSGRRRAPEPVEAQGEYFELPREDAYAEPQREESYAGPQREEAYAGLSHEQPRADRSSRDPYAGRAQADPQGESVADLPPEDAYSDLPPAGAPREEPAKPAKSRVRPYARTRGRTRSDHNLALEALISTSDDGRRYRGVRSIEHRRICDLCLDTRSVAEIAAHLHLPLGVVKILVGDMSDIGLVLIHQTDLVLGDRSSREFMERVLQGLRNL